MTAQIYWIISFVAGLLVGSYLTVGYFLRHYTEKINTDSCYSIQADGVQSYVTRLDSGGYVVYIDPKGKKWIMCLDDK